MPVLITLVVAGVFSVVLLGTAALLGQRTRHRTAVKRQSYESGVPIIDRAQKRISVKFYLVALVFVVAFLGLLVLAYLYLWRKGIFDWGRRRATTADKGRGA
jgi:NADH:ubiquinone oxidoreductase subunit 3 (subunit A)